jgi:hypothetical protein
MSLRVASRVGKGSRRLAPIASPVTCSLSISCFQPARLISAAIFLIFGKQKTWLLLLLPMHPNLQSLTSISSRALRYRIHHQCCTHTLNHSRHYIIASALDKILLLRELALCYPLFMQVVVSTYSKAIPIPRPRSVKTVPSGCL